MRYQTKLCGAFIAAGCVSLSVCVGVLHHVIKPHIFEDEQIKALSVSATTAALIDGDLLEEIKANPAPDSPAYRTFSEQLLLARDANRRHNIYINFLYTIYPNPKNPGQFIVLIDPEKDPELQSPYGYVDENQFSGELLQELKENYSPPFFIKDRWGTWLSGFSPLFDSKGNYVATVRADIALDQYLKSLKRLDDLIFFSLLLALLFASLMAFLMARRVSRSLIHLVSVVDEIKQGNFEIAAQVKTHDEFQELGEEINAMAHGLAERERLKLNFARYVSQHVLEQILQSKQPTRLEGERRKITVLFSDILQFIELCKHLPPPLVVTMLNEYFSVMLEILFSYQGTLDKFIADTLMIEFGAPLHDEEQEIHAVKAAIAMQKAFKELMIKWQKEGKPTFEMGIGIHTGEAVVGNIGSEKRFSYTAIGDTVNIAARLEQTTRTLRKPILVSETTFIALKGAIKGESLGSTLLYGRHEPIVVYAIDPEANP